MIGPNVTVAVAGHPILPELREKAYQFNMPVRIGENCWIGAGAVIMPGVTIGDNSVIGAGNPFLYGECCRLRESLPRCEGDKRARPRVLL